MTMSDLRLETWHKGFYLICQTIEPPNALDSVVTLVQDKVGGVEVVGVRFLDDYSQFLASGSIIIIKEPFYKTLGDSALIRVDSPSNIIKVYRDDGLYNKFCINKVEWKHIANEYNDRVFDSPVPDTAEKWKFRGNQLYLKKCFSDALIAYSRGIDYLETDLNNSDLWKILKLNKAACLISLKRYDPAIVDLYQVLEVDPKSEKALYRAGKCLYSLRKYNDALSVFSKLHEYYPSDNIIQEIERTMCRCKEVEFGKYDFLEMYNEAQKSNSPDLDYANYTGPIQIQALPGKGRGIVASQDISPGTLIIAAKAFAVVYGTEHDSINNCIHLNISSNKVISPQQYQLISRILARMENNPSLSPSVYQLCSGNENEYFTNIDSNVLDPNLINKICQKNAFSLEHFGASDSLEYLHDSCALFTSPTCFLNHSCERNASRMFIGDFIFIHASVHISKGSEILISYINPVETFSRRKYLLKDYGFSCDCKFCLEDKNMNVSLLDTWNTNVLPRLETGDNSILENATQLLESLKSQVSQNELGENDLFLPIVALGSLYERIGKIEYANELYKSVFNHKFLPDLSIHCALHVSLNYYILKDYKSSQKWLCKAQTLGYQIFGLESQMFKILYSDFTKDLEFLV